MIYLIRIVRLQESLQYSHVPAADHIGLRGRRDVPPADQKLHRSAPSSRFNCHVRHFRYFNRSRVLRRFAPQLPDQLYPAVRVYCCRIVSHIGHRHPVLSVRNTPGHRLDRVNMFRPRGIRGSDKIRFYHRRRFPVGRRFGIAGRVYRFRIFPG